MKAEDLLSLFKQTGIVQDLLARLLSARQLLLTLLVSHTHVRVSVCAWIHVCACCVGGDGCVYTHVPSPLLFLRCVRRSL